MRHFRTTLGGAWAHWGVPVEAHENPDAVVDVYDDGRVCPVGGATCYPGGPGEYEEFEADARELGAEIVED